MEKKMTFRLTITILTVGILMALFVGQLFRLWEDAQKSGVVDMATSLTYNSTVSAARGSILDRNGNVLVSNRASFNIELSDYVLFNSEDPNESLLQIVNQCRKLGLDYTDNLPISMEKPYEYTTEQLSSSYQYYYQQFLDYRGWDWDMSAPIMVKDLASWYGIPETWDEADIRAVAGLRYELSLRYCTTLDQYILLKDVDTKTLADFKELNIPAVMVDTVSVRQYHTDAAAHILGRVADMSPEEYQNTYKDAGYLMNAKVGKEGVELAFEEYLHGTDGTQVITVSQDGDILSQRYAVEPVAGANVILSLDLEMQVAAEQALEATILDLRENGLNDKGDGLDAGGGALVAIDVETFEVLASASYPTYDITTYSQNFSELLAAEDSPLYNRALQAAYAPGSIYKMVTSVAAIDFGDIGRHYEIEDHGVYTYYEDYQPQCLIYTNTGTTHGVINMMEALAVSCNYYFYELGRVLGIEPLDTIATRLGLGEATGVELSEEMGFRANAETKAKLYAGTYDQSWYDADTLAAAIGQSENRFTPLQMAVYTAALANQGLRYEATFLKEVVSSDYSTLIYDQESELLNDIPFSDDAMAAVSEGMSMATQTGGTATLFADYPVSVAAKTGTAQHGSVGSDHGSLICYAPVEDPKIAVAVYVENGAQGGNLANAIIPVLDEFFEGYGEVGILVENTVN